MDSIQIQENPNETIYDELGDEFSFTDIQDESKPIEFIVKQMDNIIDKISEQMMIGEHFQDLYQSNHDESFILISNHIHPVMRSGFITRFNHFDDIPFNVASYVNPKHGFANSLSILNKSSNDMEKVIVGFDSGHVLLMNSNLSTTISAKQYCHHIITKIALSPRTQKHLVCGDYGGRIVLIDIDSDMESLRYYDYAHSDSINDLAFQMNDNGNDNTLITAGSDNSILLWDFRQSTSNRPATVIANVTSKPTALYWPAENKLIFGTETGNLVMLDLRNVTKILHKHSLIENESNHNYCDNNEVITIRQTKPDKFCVITSKRFYCYERNDFKQLKISSKMDEDIELANCLPINDGNDLLIIGNNFSCIRYSNYFT